MPVREKMAKSTVAGIIEHISYAKKLIKIDGVWFATFAVVLPPDINGQQALLVRRRRPPLIVIASPHFILFSTR